MKTLSSFDTHTQLLVRDMLDRKQKHPPAVLQHILQGQQKLYEQCIEQALNGEKFNVEADLPVFESRLHLLRTMEKAWCHRAEAA